MEGRRSTDRDNNNKVRLMCSYGGHIIPRPHDKTLCYAGGETRLISVPRKLTTSLSSLTTHIAKSIKPTSTNLTLKYQLPHHDLDSLITISNDEDLSNMLEEYDRIATSPTPPSRIRFFLFFKHDDPLHDPKTESWFIDALKSAGLNNKNHHHHHHFSGESGGAESMVVEEREKNSSFGSTSSSASVHNSSPAVVVKCSGGGGGEDVGMVSGVGGVHVKVPLPSVDSLGSDSSIASANFSQQGIVYHDASGFPESKAVIPNLVETESNASDRSPRSDMLSPVQVSGYILSKTMDQARQQTLSPPPQLTVPPHYVHHPAPQSHYVTQYYPSSVPVGSYPTMYQPYVQPQQPVHYQMNKPYPVYMMPAQNPYNMSVQGSLAPPQSVTPSHTQLPSNPVMVAPPMGYEGYTPVTSAPEYAPKVYHAANVAPKPVRVSSDDHLHQVMAFPPVNPPSQHVAVTPLENTNYNNEFEDPMHAQIYKTQPPSGPTLPTQLQTTANAATVMLAESLTHLQVENTKH